MIRGYKFTKEDGTRVHIACNRQKQWYQREFVPGDRGVWKRISPPSIIGGHLRQGNEYTRVAMLSNTPVDLPQTPARPC